eukprot:gene3815-4344_t
MAVKSLKTMIRETSNLKIRSFLPIVFGVSIGFALSIVYIPIVEQFCLYDIAENSNDFQSTKIDNLKTKENSTNYQSNIETIIQVQPSVKPRQSEFNYDFRPYFIYSELGFRFKLLIAVITSEEKLEDYAVAINNTWAKELPKVIFFTAYSKNVDFHEKYNRKLNLNVVQLPDVGEDSPRVDLLFKMTQYLKDHYSSNYNLFMRVNDNAYINPKQLMKFINTLNSSEDLYVGYASKFKEQYTYEDNTYWKDWTRDTFCFGNSGLIISRNVLLKLAKNIDNCLGAIKTQDENFAYEACVRKTINKGCKLQDEVQQLFQINLDPNVFTESNIDKQKELREAAVLYPVHSSDQMLKIHKYFTLKNLKMTFSKIRSLQSDIQKTAPSLPNGNNVFSFKSLDDGSVSSRHETIT